MAINWRRGGMFAAGLVLGVAGTAALFGPGGDGEDGPTAASPVPSVAAPAEPVTVADAECASYAALVPSGGDGDGELPLDKDLQGSASAVHNHIVKGKEAAASGRLRDAEIAFLMACRSAEKLQDDPVPLADAQYQLGRHYAQVAAGAQVPRREEMLKRAQDLHANALQSYRQHRGEDHEKTRFAATGLAQVQQYMAASGMPPVAAAPRQSPAADDTRVAGNAPAPDAAAEEAARREAAAKEAAAEEAAAKEAAAREAAAKEAEAREAAAREAEAREAAAREAEAREAAAKEAEARQEAAAEAAAREAAQRQAAEREAEQARMQWEAAARQDAARQEAARQAAAREAAAARQAAAKEAAAKEAAAREAAAARSARREETRTAAVAPDAERRGNTPRRTAPSFDCALARSVTERLICADEDLARQDRELGRLHSRARQAASDPRAFQRQSDAEWQRREDTCRDRACLQRWYAQRRADLTAALERPEPAAEPPRTPPERAVVAPPRSPSLPIPAIVAPPLPDPDTASGDTGLDGPPQAEGSPFTR